MNEFPNMRCFTRDATDEPRGITVARRSPSASRMWDAWQEHLSQLTLAELQSSPTTSHHIQRLSLRLVESSLSRWPIRPVCRSASRNHFKHSRASRLGVSQSGLSARV